MEQSDKKKLRYLSIRSDCCRMSFQRLTGIDSITQERYWIIIYILMLLLISYRFSELSYMVSSDVIGSSIGSDTAPNESTQARVFTIYGGTFTLNNSQRVIMKKENEIASELIVEEQEEGEGLHVNYESERGCSISLVSREEKKVYIRIDDDERTVSIQRSQESGKLF